jgi:hypothetical protein
MALMAELKTPANKVCRQFNMLTTKLKQTAPLEVGIYVTCRKATLSNELGALYLLFMF